MTQNPAPDFDLPDQPGQWDRSMAPGNQPPEPPRQRPNSMVLAAAIGVAVLLVVLSALAGILIMRQHRRCVDSVIDS